MIYYLISIGYRLKLAQSLFPAGILLTHLSLPPSHWHDFRRSLSPLDMFRPRLHHRPALLKQVGPVIRRLRLVADRVRQGPLGEIASVAILRGPVAERRAKSMRGGDPLLVAALGLVFVPPRFVYREVSKQVQSIFRDYTPLVEPLSLDEAYLDVTDNLKGIPTAWETAKEIRARIYEETSLTASAGISCNKFLAKIASDYRKPNGQFAIMPDQAEAFVAILPVAKFHGVGPKDDDKNARPWH
jgi:hypothetical protein